MNVILLERLKNLGHIGDKVSVRPGYGRNFLIPQGKAVAATPANIEAFEARRAELEKHASDVLAAAKKRADVLSSASLSLTVKASEEGKLFGSIGPREIALALTEQGHEVSKSEVIMSEGALRHVGEADVELHLHTDVSQTIKVVIEAE